MAKPDYINAHSLSNDNKKYLENVDKCDCFYCLKIFNPRKIKEWCDNGKAAICPYCGIDSIIYNSKTYPVTLKKRWNYGKDINYWRWSRYQWNVN